MSNKVNFILDATIGHDQHRTEQDYQAILGGRRRVSAADPDRQHLRHELPNLCRAFLGHGYPLANPADDCLAILPYAYFKRKGWL